MAFEAFVASEQAGRRGRLAASSLAAAALLWGLIAAAAVASPASADDAHKPIAEAMDEVLDVKLASRPEPAPPTPAPPVPAALVPRSIKLNPDAAPPRPLSAPKEVPKERPREADPSADKGVAGVHEGGDPAGRGASGSSKATAPAPTPAPTPPPAAPPPAPAAPRVTTISEDTEPPVPVSQPRPQPPAEFVAAGEDAFVVVKFEVTEGGDVTNVRVVKGHPLLDAAVMAAVRGWKFKPATSQGRPVAYPKTVKIPFRIRT